MDHLVYAPQRPFGPGQAYVALSRVTRLAGLHVIQRDADDPDDDLALVDLSASIFTAFNEKLAAVDVEMRRLDALARARERAIPTTPAARVRRRDTTESDQDRDLPSPTRPRRAARDDV